MASTSKPPRRRRVLIGVLGVLLLLVAYLTLWPVSIQPEAWSPPVAPSLASGPYVQGERWGATRLARALPGCEAIAFDRGGWLYTGTLDGRVMRMRPDGTQVGTYATTGGRPLGLKFGPDGALYVADAEKGLLSIAADGTVTVLADAHEGQRFVFTDDLALARDGTIYFTDASTRFPLRDFMSDVLEHGPNGRLYAYHPKDKRTELVLKDLYFANGVALAPDEQSLLVTETTSYRVRRVFLTAPRRGQWKVFVDNLPGFPDNVTYSPSRNVYWVAVGAPRDGTLDDLAGSPFLRRVVARLPAFLRPKAKRRSFALAFSPEGRLVHTLQDWGDASYSPLASIVEHEGQLYLGSFQRSGYARVQTPR